MGENLTVALLHLDGTVEDEGGTLVLVDLTATRLTSYAAAEGLVLSVGIEGAMVTLTLTCDATLPFALAAAWLNELAGRVEDPVRQLI